MGGGVDAAREARGDDEAHAAPSSAASREAMRQPRAEALRAPTSATAGRAASAGSPIAQRNGRRVGDGGEQRRVVGGAEKERRAPRPRRRGHSASTAARGQGGVVAEPGLGGDRGQSVERRRRRAVLADEADEGRGADPPRAGEPEPVERCPRRPRGSASGGIFREGGVASDKGPPSGDQASRPLRRGLGCRCGLVLAGQGGHPGRAGNAGSG